jgi:hypothetical protein
MRENWKKRIDPVEGQEWNGVRCGPASNSYTEWFPLHPGRLTAIFNLF